MSRAVVNPYIGGLSREVWLWARRRIHTFVVAAGHDDLTPAQLAVFRNPTIEDMRPGELADEMQITKQSVNELLGHLERRGYLVRVPDPLDSRSRRIQLTARGRDLEELVRKAAEQAEQDAAALMGVDRMRDLRRTLADLVAHLADASGPPPQKVQRVAP
jgi:DNA-binding MarR family transcriptional regulator